MHLYLVRVKDLERGVVEYYLTAADGHFKAERQAEAGIGARKVNILGVDYVCAMKNVDEKLIYVTEMIE